MSDNTLPRPAVVVLAYNRPAALRRLLDSLGRAAYPAGGDVTLVVSIDHAETAARAEVVALAHAFEWPHGPKHVLDQQAHLGVVGHFRAAGALSREYGGIVLLEDDLSVAPSFYDFASRVQSVYRDDERIAGCCLYGLWFNGFTHEPFLPVEDGSDVFFLRLPYTQGLSFTTDQWTAYERWSQGSSPPPAGSLHPAFQRFGPDEWFPSLAAYLAATGRYFCFPRVSQTVGWGDAGAHFASGSAWFQTPLQAAPADFRLPALDGAIAVYDGFFELEQDRLRRLTRPGTLPDAAFDLDLNATKLPKNLNHDLVLTSRPVRRAIATFGLQMYPPELNIVWAVSGDDLALARREDVLWDRWAESDARRRLHAYYWRRLRPSRRRDLRFAVARLVASIRARLKQTATS